MRKKRLAVVAMAGLLAVGSSASAQFGQQYSQRCVTPQFWCMMQYPLPVGSNCFCPTPYGPVYGRAG